MSGSPVGHINAAGCAHWAFSARAARGRAIVDYVASLTDGQAVAMLDALTGRSGQLWTDAFVL